MTVFLPQDTGVDVKTYLVRLRSRGQITVPQAVRDNLNITAGDVLTLLQVGDVIFFTPIQPQVPRLADKIVEMMEAKGVSLADLLAGLEEEREAIRRERQQDA